MKHAAIENEKLRGMITDQAGSKGVSGSGGKGDQKWQRGGGINKQIKDLSEGYWRED